MRIQRPGLFAALLALMVCLLPRVPAAGSAREQLLPFYSNDGIAGLIRRLRRVESGVRVLHVAAHPDDEDSALLAWLSLGRGARVTYLSLTRGEGGQNLIGPEHGAELGVLRTSELLAARELDGANQLFGRMIDFGFSKSPEECFEKWGRENVVEDIVRAIRLTRPHIIICRFQGTAQDGHGQHQASAIAAREAYEKAADPNYLPDSAKEGLNPWQADKFYVGSFDPSDNRATHADTGEYDPLEGRSYAAIGYRGRSRHRSQDMGMIEYETPMRDSAYILEKTVHGDLKNDPELFSGVLVEYRELRRQAAGIRNLEGIASDPAVASARIAELLGLWRGQARDEIETICDLEHALAISLGIRTEALSKTGHLHHGEEVEVICNAYLPDFEVLGGYGWNIEGSGFIRVTEQPEKQEQPMLFEGATSILQGFFKLGVVQDIPSTPYFLRNQAEGALYARANWVSSSMPFDPPLAVARFLMEFNSMPLALSLPVETRVADPAFGEIREDLQVVPGISGRFENPIMVINNTASAREKEIRIRVRASAAFEGKIDLNWKSGAQLGRISGHKVFVKPGQEQVISIPGSVLSAMVINTKEPVELTLAAETSAEPEMIYQAAHLDYRHIRPRYMSVPARAEIHRVAVALPADLRVGYVPGAKDAVAQTLGQLGLDLMLLHEGDLASADLSKFDAIVLGARAYEVRSDLAANNARLFEYVEEGGTLVVQYNQYGYADNKFAPRPFKMRRPHDRVTDENARVTILDPGHPVFHFPNKVTESDFDGWIQERGLYFWSEWDEQFEPLMSCADPGEPQQKGGMMHLRLGKGHFIYTGYSFFRQLPTGHEGAAKLFVNLLSIGRASVPEVAR